MLINLTNHPSHLWAEEQKVAASIFGDVEDYAFPLVSPFMGKDQVLKLAEFTFGDIKRKYGIDGITIHIMGEQTLCYALIRLFMANGIPCLASTTERISVDNVDGSKTSVFKFVQFREY